MILIVLRVSFKQKGNDDTKDVEIMVNLNHVSNFLTTFEISLNNCELIN